jgi:5-methylcytosine-specific restriction endonuclease McrA
MHSLKGLSDRELVARLQSLVEKEKSLTLEIVSHLVEVARRGLHLGKGYGSLYEYCRGELGYTDASAWRRARAAQAILRCPEAWERLVEGRVTLCTLGRVHGFITPAVLEEICGKSKAEVEWIAARYDAKGVSPDRTRPVMVPKPAGAIAPSAVATSAAPANGGSAAGLRSEVMLSNQGSPRSLRSEVGPPEQSDVSGLRSEVASGRIERSDKIEFEQKWKLEGVVSKQVKAKLDRCKSLLSRKYPRGVDYEILFGELSEVFLERFDPKRKKERRQKRETIKKRPAKTPTKANPSRHIPAREKEHVWTRDEGRCAYVGADGKRCNSTFDLQIDHFPIPFARGGPSKASNLRLLCARHNRYTARQTFGHLCDARRAAKADDPKHTEPLTHKRE